MEFKVESILSSSNSFKYKVIYLNKSYDLWLTYNTERFDTREEATEYIKKIKKAVRN